MREMKGREGQCAFIKGDFPWKYIHISSFWFCVTLTYMLRDATQGLSSVTTVNTWMYQWWLAQTHYVHVFFSQYMHNVQ